jgi:hypothetical protein
MVEKVSIPDEIHDNRGTDHTNAADEPPENAQMDIKQFLAYLVANAAFNLSGKDVKRLAELAEPELAEAIANAVQVPITEELARKTLEDNGLTVLNAAEFSATDYADFIANADSFGEFKTAKAAERAETVDGIIANSEMVAEDLTDMDDAKLTKLANSLKPVQDYSGGASPVGMSNRERSGEGEGVTY